MAARVLALALGLAACLAAAHGFLAKQAPVRIDCGATTAGVIVTSTGARLKFTGDVSYTSGVPASIPTSSALGLNAAETTLRYFPTDTTSCYKLKVEKGRYLVRLGWAYFNYDNQNNPPRFGVFVQGTLVETVDIGVVQNLFDSGAYYSDYIAFALEGNLTVCMQPLPTQGGMVFPPFLNTLEVLPMDTDAYNADKTGQNVILSSYLRLNMGGNMLGPEPADLGHRTWMGDVNSTSGKYRTLRQAVNIRDAEGAPDYLPQAIFWSAREAMAPDNATGFRMNIVPVDRSNNWYLRYYFAELNTAVKKGERLFNILLGSGSAFQDIGTGPDATAFDILNKTNGPLSAVVVPVFFNFTVYSESYGQDLEVGVRTAPGSKYQAVLSAVELYELIPVTGYSFESSSENGDGTDGTDGTTQDLSSSNSSSGGLSGGAIAAIVIGVVLGVAVITVVAIFVFRRRADTFERIDVAEGA